jgi:hypothetical protein
MPWWVGQRGGEIRFYLVQSAVTLAVLLAVMEVWARLFPPRDSVVWPLTQNPAVGTTFLPHSRVVFTNGLDFRVEEYANEAGFLDRPLPPVARSGGSCRIAILGDSYVEAAQVPIRQKVQVLLEKLAEARWPDLDVETMAFGFSGTGQLNQLGYLDAYVRPRRPDIVVLVFVGNDFADNSALLTAVRVGWHPEHTPRIFARESEAGAIEIQGIDPGWRSHLLPPPTDTRPWLHSRLHRISRFYRWLYAKLTLQFPELAPYVGREPAEADRSAARLAALTEVNPAFAHMFSGWDRQSSPGLDAMFREQGQLLPAFEQALRFTSFAFDSYKARALEDGSKLIVLASQGIDGPLEERLRQMLAERSIPYLSLRDYIARQGGSVDQARWPHDSHWSPQGHVWAAELLLEQIAANRLCGRS